MERTISHYQERYGEQLNAAKAKIERECVEVTWCFDHWKSHMLLQRYLRDNWQARAGTKRKGDGEDKSKDQSDGPAAATGAVNAPESSSASLKRRQKAYVEGLRQQLGADCKLALTPGLMR